MSVKNKVIVYTDGSSLGNPGPGGWGAVLIFEEDKVVEIGGKESNTTNNRMELTASIRALERISPNVSVVLYTDSKYVFSGITEWIYNWQEKNWRTASKKPVLNKDLWEELLELNNKLNVKWEHLLGHSGIKWNERADTIATSFAQDEQILLKNGSKEDYERTADKS